MYFNNFNSALNFLMSQYFLIFTIAFYFLITLKKLTLGEIQIQIQTLCLV